jgi:hypothetical protein
MRVQSEVETKANDEVLEDQKADHHMLKELASSEATNDIISDTPETETVATINIPTKPLKKVKIAFKTYTLNKEWISMRHFNGFIKSAQRVKHNDFPEKDENTKQMTMCGSDTPSPTKSAPCSCPTNQSPLACLDALPSLAIPNNVSKMKEWLDERFAASTFNCCPHQHLPLMQGDPIRIHIDPDARPIMVFTTAMVPTHWRDQIQAQLDEALGIIEKVLPRVPTTWQVRIHIAPKVNGNPQSPQYQLCPKSLSMWCHHSSRLV